MARPRLYSLATALLLLSMASACAGPARSPAQPPPQQASRYPSTEADVRFMSAMIGHHAQALVMAGWAPTHGAGASVLRLAERIMNGQQDEIATMQQWLRDRGRPIPQGAPQGHHSMHGHLMPGMLTEAQMHQLAEAKGPEFDRLFLTFMIQHHRGAVAMVKQLFGTPGAAQDQTVFKFASDVNVDQTTEIARMERMLSALPAGEPSS
jgi:uncharacterized protein (DUF305 family)